MLHKGIMPLDTFFIFYFWLYLPYFFDYIILTFSDCLLISSPVHVATNTDITVTGSLIRHDFKIFNKCSTISSLNIVIIIFFLQIILNIM